MIDLPNTLPDQKYYTERIETSGPWDEIRKALRMLYFLKIPPPFLKGKIISRLRMCTAQYTKNCVISGALGT